MENREYQAPGPNDSRSPCPALNTLANHGYLPRNGKDITPGQLVEAIYKGYNISKVLGFILAHGEFLALGKTIEGKLSLEDLYNGPIEHAMSLTRPDEDSGEDYKKVSQKLLDSLFAEKNDNNKLTRESFARQFIKRRDQSIRENPKFHGLYYPQKIQVGGEYALTLICFPENENGRGEEIDVNTLESFYKFERLPENWKTPVETVSLFQTRDVAGDIRNRIDNLDKEDKKKN